MTPQAAKALQCETDFLAGVDGNFEAAKGKDLRGSSWKRSTHDESDRLRALMAQNRVYDRDKLKTLPANRRVALHGFERRLLLWKRRTGVAIASVLCPLEHFAASKDQEPPPIGLGELADHVRKLVGDGNIPHLVGVCSPSGFTDEAKQAKLDMAGATVVLIEPDGSGGWRTQATGEDVDPRVLKIFDPEGAKQKAERVRRLVDERSTDLLTGGLSVSGLAKQANLPEDVVREAFERIAREDPELKVAKRDGAFLLFRGAAAQAMEKPSMNVIDRIRRLLSGEGNEGEKINLLAERRAALAQRRDRIYEDITKLEDKEADLVGQGKAATSQVPRRRLAAQIAQMRKDIARHNTSAGMLNQQINIISTDIHNLTLIQQGELAKLPDTEELTENAVKAEEMLESLKADADLVGGLEMGMEQALVSDDELAVLREFEAADAKGAVADATTSEREAPAKTSTSPPPQKQVDKTRARESESPPPVSQKDSDRDAAGPEPT